MLDILEKILKKPEPVPYIGSGSGALRSRLIEIFRDQLEDEVEPDSFEAVLSDLSVSFQPAGGEPGGKIVFNLFCERLDSGENWKFNDLPVSLLGDEEIEDLVAQVRQTVPENYFEGDGVQPRSGKTVLRKAGPEVDDDDSLEGLMDIRDARKNLRVSAKWLKEWIPCTTWREVEAENSETAMLYYWSSVLIDMLKQIKSSPKVTRKQREYISGECCYGDDTWASEIIGALRKK